MARQLPALIALTFAATLFAEERPPVDPLASGTPKTEQKPAGSPGHGGGSPGPGMHHPGPGGGGPGFFNGPDAEKARQAFQQMTPEDRQRWMQRFKEFAEMSPEKKKEIFERSEYFRRKMREDVEAALKESGLNLSEEQKKKFAERYFEERKKIEEDLRKQMEEVRQPKLHALAAKLREEFATSSAQAPQ